MPNCVDSCGELGVGFGTPDGLICTKCNLDHCLSYDEACQCLNCSEGFYVISDPVTLIEICIPCEVHGCISCGSDGKGCNKCEQGFELIEDKCIGDQSPPTSTPTQTPPTDETSQTDVANETETVLPVLTSSYVNNETKPSDNGSGSNSSSKDKAQKIGLLAGIVVAIAVIIVLVIVVIVLVMKRNSSKTAALKTEDMSGEMQHETENNDIFKNSYNLNSTDNPVFPVHPDENKVVEDPFINDFDEGKN